MAYRDFLVEIPSYNQKVVIAAMKKLPYLCDINMHITI